MATDEFRISPGFEDVWRPPVRLRQVRPEGRPANLPANVRARLWRVVRRAPEVMVKVTGRTRDPAHLAAHLTYVTRNGALPAEGRDGPVVGRTEVMDTARDWAALELMDDGRRTGSPFSVSILLSMPAGTDAFAVRDAARAFAAETFAERHDYVAVLHTDTPHPHVHLTVRAGSDDGGPRLNPRKADLEAWRQRFAEALRARGVEAEATPRRARGVTRKAERTSLRKMRDRAERGDGPRSRVVRSAYLEAGRAAFGGDHDVRPWEARLARRHAQVQARYLEQARLLLASADPEDRRLGLAVVRFVQEMAEADSRRLALARELRAASRGLDGRDRAPPARDRGGKGRG